MMDTRRSFRLTGAVVATLVWFASMPGCGGVETPCAEGQDRCDEVCVDLQTNRANCGACGTACSDKEVCEEGACVCPASTVKCQGECVDPEKEINNCDCGDGDSTSNPAVACFKKHWLQCPDTSPTYNFFCYYKSGVGKEYPDAYLGVAGRIDTGPQMDPLMLQAGTPDQYPAVWGDPFSKTGDRVLFGLSGLPSAATLQLLPGVHDSPLSKTTVFLCDSTGCKGNALHFGSQGKADGGMWQGEPFGTVSLTPDPDTGRLAITFKTPTKKTP